MSKLVRVLAACATALLGPLAFVLALACALPAAAHDCSGPDDCTRLPPNVDAATGLAAGAAGAAAGWAYFRSRRADKPPPCDELRGEVRHGEARIAELEAQIAAAEGGTGGSDPPPSTPR